ncbi:flagellar hook-associated protein 1 FlgK [Limimaricola soesokkakensis]|uniref:Flagellar hook-associated protein 1 n=1 Tax=Limimaricola soesokkakensis TaxID=1343159 RepID=A0A1X7A832_9RHOB|nr:flagellar hook-associated protein FlgK [Limimaricola soesokkakensis]PSK80184.1 flagellar hook-associated protein 1 FlgK [Limimaricola soesokkakensis]SLN72821.1 Flagellar hook-associated protein 1 [Limimaricola soesokkakensis]
MGITAAFNASRTGLAAVESWSEMTSSNIANASRAGYSKRSAPMTSLPGGGVAVTGYARAADARLEQAHRQEISRVAGREVVASALASHAVVLGEIDSATGLHGRLATFQSALDAVASDPAQPALQESAVKAAVAMASTLRGAADSLALIESDTRAGVRSDVSQINETLTDIAEINRQISRENGPTERRAALEDNLSTKLDGLSEILDVRTSYDAGGRISIFTTGGAPLVENDSVRVLKFDEQTDRLSIDGVDVTPGGVGSRGSEEGRLAGRLGLLGGDLPRMQLQLDEMARALVQGFEAADDSLAAGQPGLFTDGGDAYSAADLKGLASRIAVNDAVRSDAGGGAWRLRDGVGAVAQGPASDGRRIDGYVTMLAGTTSFDESAGLGQNRTLADFAAGLIADHQQMRNTARDEAEALGAGRDAAEAARSAVQGVNIDEELQQLMLIEQSYSANATVMKTLGEMMDTLLAAVR